MYENMNETTREQACLMFMVYASQSIMSLQEVGSTLTDEAKEANREAVREFHQGMKMALRYLSAHDFSDDEDIVELTGRLRSNHALSAYVGARKMELSESMAKVIDEVLEAMPWVSDTRELLEEEDQFRLVQIQWAGMEQLIRTVAKLAEIADKYKGLLLESPTMEEVTKSRDELDAVLEGEWQQLALLLDKIAPEGVVITDEQLNEIGGQIMLAVPSLRELLQRQGRDHADQIVAMYTLLLSRVSGKTVYTIDYSSLDEEALEALLEKVRADLPDPDGSKEVREAIAGWSPEHQRAILLGMTDALVAEGERMVAADFTAESVQAYETGVNLLMYVTLGNVPLPLLSEILSPQSTYLSRMVEAKTISDTMEEMLKKEMTS